MWCSVPCGLGTLPKLKSLALEGNPLRTIRRDILTVSHQNISAPSFRALSLSLEIVLNLNSGGVSGGEIPNTMFSLFFRKAPVNS